MGKLINWAVLIGVGYFLYTYLGTGDITLMPPNKTEVLAIANQHKGNLSAKQHLSVGEKCKRIGGGWIKEGIYSCEIQVFESRELYAKPKATYELVLEKKNSKWQVKPQ